MLNPHYIGRFAPSPSGALHFGSLIAALGSFLQARSQQGKWLVRIEDIDPPREVPGAASQILTTLEHYGLFWDGDILYQSQRKEAYLEVLNQLKAQDMAYCCDCTRSRIQSLGGFYDGYCRHRNNLPENTALRLHQTKPVYTFYDGLLGTVKVNPKMAKEDFIIHRRDGLFAYNLAVVVDDHYQRITEIVRGADLIEPTARQLSLYRLLGYDEPGFIHLPLAVNEQGHKLSKQNHAPALSLKEPVPVLVAALNFLGQTLPASPMDATKEELISWAITHWSLKQIPAHREITQVVTL